MTHAVVRAVNSRMTAHPEVGRGVHPTAGRLHRATADARKRYDPESWQKQGCGKRRATGSYFCVREERVERRVVHAFWSRRPRNRRPQLEAAVAAAGGHLSNRFEASVTTPRGVVQSAARQIPRTVPGFSAFYDSGESAGTLRLAVWVARTWLARIPARGPR